MANPNIVGKDLKPIKERTGEAWRYKYHKTEWGTFPEYENSYSDNNGHQESLPIQPTIRRK